MGHQTRTSGLGPVESGVDLKEEEGEAVAGDAVVVVEEAVVVDATSRKVALWTTPVLCTKLSSREGTL